METIDTPRTLSQSASALGCSEDSLRYAIARGIHPTITGLDADDEPLYETEWAEIIGSVDWGR